MNNIKKAIFGITVLFITLPALANGADSQPDPTELDVCSAMLQPESLQSVEHAGRLADVVRDTMMILKFNGYDYKYNGTGELKFGANSLSSTLGWKVPFSRTMKFVRAEEEHQNDSVRNTAGVVTLVVSGTFQSDGKPYCGGPSWSHVQLSVSDIQTSYTTERK